MNLEQKNKHTLSTETSKNLGKNKHKDQLENHECAFKKTACRSVWISRGKNHEQNTADGKLVKRAVNDP